MARGNPNFGEANVGIPTIAQPDAAAMVASRLANLQHGGDRHSEDFKVGIPTLRQTEAAAMLNVSRDSVVQAKKVLDQGDQSLIELEVGSNQHTEISAPSQNEAATMLNVMGGRPPKQNCGS